jgi:hypothetical protein
MGLGDFLKGAGVALINSNPVTAQAASAGAAALDWAGNELYEQFQGHQRAERAPTGGATSLDRSPLTHHTIAAVEGPAAAPYRVAGQQLEQSAQNKIDAATGYYKLADMLVTNPTQVWRRGKQFAGAVKENPAILGHIATEAAISTALDPMTYVGFGLTGGLQAAEGVASRAGRRALTETVEEAGTQLVTHSADDIAESLATTAGREVAEEGAQFGSRSAAEIAEESARQAAPSTAEAAQVAGRRTTRSGRFLEAVDQAPANLRETIGRSPIGRVTQARIDLGERVMPGAQESIPRALAKDWIQGSPTLPTEGAGLAFRQSKWRAQQIGRRAMLPSRVNTARQVEKVGRIINDPQGFLQSPEAGGLIDKGINWAVTEHPEAVAAVGGALAATQAYGALKTLKGLTGGDEEAAPEHTTPYEVPDSTVQGIGLMQFRSQTTRSTRTSRRRPSAPAQLGTVSSDTTMPTQIGPSNWYGPQGGYTGGRGFVQPSAAPREWAAVSSPSRQREMVGI